MILVSLLALLQQSVPPTVGDTIWLERTIETPAGAEVRAAQWTPADPIGLLGRPVIRREGSRTVVSYPAVAWSAGTHLVQVPGPIIIGRDGTTDSLPPETRTVVVASVLPDSLPPERLPVQPEAGIVLERVTTPYPVLVALLVGILLFSPLAWWWLRPGPPMPAFKPPSERLTPPLADWGEAGETRAVAAVAARALRSEILSHLPGIPQGLVASRLVRVVAEQRPAWPVDEIGTVLRALEAAQYAPAAPGEILGLADRASDLRRKLENVPVGGGKTG
jgi:hypothetical protein